jgi:hypothetical protein
MNEDFMRLNQIAEGVSPHDHAKWRVATSELWINRGSFTVSTAPGFSIDAEKEIQTERLESLDILMPSLFSLSVLNPELPEARGFLERQGFHRKSSIWTSKWKWSSFLEIPEILNGVPHLIECDRDRVHWDGFFGSCFDPTVVMNLTSLIPPALVRKAKRVVEEGRVALSFTSTAYTQLDLTIFEESDIDRSLFSVSMKNCMVTERFRVLAAEHTTSSGREPSGLTPCGSPAL